MADITRNGVINSPYVNHTYYLKLELTILEQDIANNKSRIRLRQYAYSTSTTYQAWSGSETGNSYYIKINGSNVVSGTKSMDFRNLAIVELGLYEGWVTHVDNGELTIAVSSGFDINGPSSLYDGYVPSYNWALTTIPRYAAITSFTVTDITCIQFKINYAVDRAIDDAEYSLNGGAWANIPSGGIITGRSPGTLYKVKIRVKATASQLWTYSSEISKTTVALSSITTSASFNLESALAVTISRPSTSLYHDLTLEAYYDSAWRAVALNTAQSNRTTSGSISPTTSALNTLFTKHPTSKTVSVRVKMVVRWGSSGTIQGTVYKTGTASIVNANPTIASVSYLDTSSAVQAILGNNQKILRNKSSLRVVAGTAASQKGATLKNYKVSIGGNNYSVNAAASVTTENGKEINVGAVNQSANQTAVLTVTDSRGNTVTRSFTVQILDYQAPQILQAVPQRLNSYEEPTTMIVEGRRYTVKPSTVDVNEVYLRYRIKENPSGTYGAWIDLTKTDGSVSGLWKAIAVDQYMADYPNTKSYTVELQISDKFTSWVSTLLELPEGLALLRMLKDRLEAGVDFEIKDNKALILESPNGTRYKIKVNDSGTITTAIA